MARHSTRRGFKIEDLESRQMMAGDVTAYAINRILYVSGDALANGVAVVGSVNGSVDVIGLAQGGSATTVNHGSSGNFTRIKDVVVTTGKGDDSVVVTNVFVNGMLFVDGGQGNDAVGLGEFDDTNNQFDDAIDHLMGALSVKSNAIVSGGDGNNDIISQEVTVSKSITIGTGTGNDSVFAQNTIVGKTLSIGTGNGNDTVNLTGTGNPGDLNYVPGVNVAKATSITTGSGDDDVTLNKLTSKSLTVTLGNNNDTVTVDDVAITKDASFDGNKDANTYVDLAGNTFGKLKRKNFQTII